MKLNFRSKSFKISIILFLLALLIHSVVGTISLKSFFNLTALEIIFSGIFISVIVSFSFDTLITTITMIKKSFSDKIDYEGTINKVHTLSIKVKRDGVLSIQSDIEEEKNTFLKDAMILLNDYKKPDIMKDILIKDIESRRSNLYRSYNVLKMIAHIAPSFGLIGTLLGLVGLLSNIHEVNLIMSNMASALVSTLYGSLIANFIAVPLMGRLKEYIDKNILHYHIMTEGILLIAQNDTARNVFDKMNVMLKEDTRLIYPRKKITERNDYDAELS
ncbi:motility protein A [Crassaminicella profunda]|uniref:motility protein A n=1 Tax=Crassaminicella profunda TaxID=1286698 RepID=UPI001CA666BB|nr:MotA/TolQ/ExbB proton channel family protein [Crassaminicella profunda]QZY55270.1 MotA/TolQ/ExbB proton channel family protein [Crassaminicella profunda]